MTRALLVAGCAVGGATIFTAVAWLWLNGWSPQFEDQLYRWQ